MDFKSIDTFSEEIKLEKPIEIELPNTLKSNNMMCYSFQSTQAHIQGGLSALVSPPLSRIDIWVLFNKNK